MSNKKSVSIKDQLLQKSSALGKRIALPEAHDPRILKAAVHLAEHQICRPVLVGDPDEIKKLSKASELLLSEDIEIISPAGDAERQSYAELLYERRKHRGMTIEQAGVVLENPLWFACALLNNNRVDGCLAGADNATAEVIKSALFQVGTKPGGLVSSCFLMVMPDGRNFTYGDCGVVPYPEQEQLAVIAADTAESHVQLTGSDPRVAFLSFSTKGSAAHERVDLVSNALKIFRKNHPEIQSDGELQFDAALVPSVAAKKAPESSVAGKANVFIFPNLDAGNIGYKITERLAGATALGPILQGLSKPVNDLSRGCSVEDVILMSAVTSIQAS